MVAFERVEGTDTVRVDLGGDDVQTAEHFAPAGDDSPPLPDDTAALADGGGTGELQAVGYDDPTAKKAAAGEKRIYARDLAGNVVAEIWLRRTGDIEITTVAPNTKVKVNGGAQSVLRGEDFLAYLDAILDAMAAGLGGVPSVGAGLQSTFEAAITTAAPLRAASLSQVHKTG